MAKEDLIPVRSVEEAKEKGRRGGIASGIARRRKKNLRESLKMLMEMKATDKESIEAMKQNNVDVEDMTNATMVGLALMNKAKKGNVPAQRLLAEMVGENDVQGVTKIPNGSINVNFIKPSEGDS